MSKISREFGVTTASMFRGAAPVTPGRAALLAPITLLTTDELAAAFGYSRPNGAFRTFCAGLGIEPVPGRRNRFDPRMVRACLDTAQGLGTAANHTNAPDHEGSLVAQRRARNGSR